MVLVLTEELANRIRTYGVERYPHECCGAILGKDHEKGREAVDLLPLVNRREDSPRNRFSLTPEDFRAAEKAARERGLELVGWYHSHPDHPARPSDYDREHAWPWYSYVIVSVEDRKPTQMTSWRLADDRTRFDPEEIEVRVRATPSQAESHPPEQRSASTGSASEEQGKASGGWN